ncbi:3-keto-5-aminohexanoate cleavage protein [Dinoroseobacter sp. PD6]|uniref:3-keto-5-aminohexanoate cleavage protein n=1 Tax=Dinoroseobacter sp. PD6 TaxID=3028384 RepID=UPI00237BCFD7|nr:3-keto-5-aminohexanoate cleavage protein [Dinoroseobacter sp. PD6]MDD9718882.1 3-keto-5-aminohexanoate cleavage protein [Dinoroseobacter sp. PD6]
MPQICLEVALNGPWSRSLQPGMPITTDELIAQGIACARAGAAVVHVHVYDPDTGRQREDYDAYAKVIEGIRAVEDVIVYPTLPLSGSRDAATAMTPEARFAVVEALARDGLLEWAVVDPGCAILSSLSEIRAGREGFVYHNSEAEVRHGLDLARTYGFHPSYAIYEPGFARLGAALAAQVPGVPRPIYRFMFSEGFTFGYPPRGYALDSYLALMAELDPGAPCMIAGLQVDILPLIGAAVPAGVHVRVGLEDAPFGTELSNIGWTEAAAQAIAQSGGTLAGAAEIRRKIAGR